jgi:antitoxin (DNA-binding transcriptional repressor) of toxin-antitoxin stability system
MEVPITQFRREIFSLMNQALDGAEVWVTHKGRRIKIVPEGRPASRLSRITPMDVFVNPNFDMNDPAFKAEWLADMEKEWEAEWDRDFGTAADRGSAGSKSGIKS